MRRHHALTMCSARDRRAHACPAPGADAIGMPRSLLHSRDMSGSPSQRRLSVPDMEAILAVTSKLAAPFDLMTMLAEVVSAAKQVLQGRSRLGVAVRRRGRRAGPGDRDRHRAGARAGRRRARRRVRARPPDHQRPRLLCRRALRPGRRPALRLPDALHADAAAGRPQGRPRRRDAGAEQGGRRVRRRATRRSRRRWPRSARSRCSGCA